MFKVVAFFDLDRTLIDVNSAVLYALYERRHGRIGILQVLSTLAYTALYHLNLLNMEEAYRRALRYYRGIPEVDMDRNVRKFFSDEIEGRLQPGAKRILDYHKSQGHGLVLLSTSSQYQAQAAADAWGLDAAIANSFPTQNGRLTGQLASPFCYGQGKVEAAEAWLEGTGIQLKDCYFYSDSYSDLPMLKRVGYPRVVNPDPKLRTYTKRLRWDVLDWSEVNS